MSVNLGNFAEVCLEFLLMVFAVFLLVRFINRLKESAEKRPDLPTPARPERQEVLLTEIRDLLAAQQNPKH